MRLSREYLPATGSARQELVLLHGWGSNREMWRPLLAALRPWANVSLLDLPGCAPGCIDGGAGVELDDVLAAVLACAPQQAVYLGWSLGGQLALALAARAPDRVSAVVTICSNPRFVASVDWPGMPPGVFAGFRDGYQANPAGGLRRFDSLQVGGSNQPRALLRQLQIQRQGPPGLELLAGLAWLEQLDQRTLLAQLPMPQLHLLAEQDELVPCALRESLQQLVSSNCSAQVRVLAAAGHLLPLDSAPVVAAEAREFLATAGLLASVPAQLPMPAKKDVAASFSRAASGYDSVAKLQRDVGQQLLGKLDAVQEAPTKLLDLGCGTGSFRPALRQRYPRAAYIGLDLAPGMVDYARARAADDSIWLVGDAEAMPLAAGAVDLVFSSLAVQWCHRPEQLFAELARILRPGGRCFFTTLGPDTLCELRAAWAAVDGHQHVNRFLPPADLLAAAQRIPELSLSLATEYHRMEYSRVGELLSELKTLGAHNMNRDRPAGLTSRRALQGMLAAYEAQREEGVLPATYEVIFGEVYKL